MWLKKYKFLIINILTILDVDWAVDCRALEFSDVDAADFDFLFTMTLEVPDVEAIDSVLLTMVLGIPDVEAVDSLMHGWEAYFSKSFLFEG